MDLLIGERQSLFRESLITVLRQHGHRIAGVADDPDELVDLAATATAQGCVTDLFAPTADTPDVVVALLRVAPDLEIVALSSDERPGVAARVLDSGAAAFLHRSCEVSTLLRTLERVARHEVVRTVGRRPSRGALRPSDPVAAAGLTSRELQCLAMLARGASTQAMAQALGVSTTTVRSHVQGLMTKLDVHSRVAAASLAARFLIRWDEVATGQQAQTS